MSALPTITITVAEGTIVWVPSKDPRKEGRWRLLPEHGRGTRPVPRRLLAQAGLLKKGGADG